MRHLVPAISALIIFAACASSKKTAGQLPEQKLAEVSYGSFPSSKMDVFLPANRTPKTPFVIIMHGGAWTIGTKVWGTRTQDSLAAHGIASANIEYRYADDYNTHYPELLKDIDSAIRYCIAHAKEWNTRATNFTMNGESAGAHLALMYGFMSDKKIGAIVTECAPTDFSDTAMLNHYAKADSNILHAIAKMTGARYDPLKPLDPAYAAASPVSHVKNIPTLMFHGTADQLVPFSQATTLEKKLTQKGVTHQLVAMPGAGHDVGFNTPEGRSKIYGEMVEWIWKYGR